GGPLKSQSLMRDSYTPDVFQKTVIDPRHWHGRTINELGRWYEKYFLDLNVQKAMKEKYW
ncbi:TEX33 protein, partial [Alaudala cheleensis]|nr:TEX33 protein [Alaudala cheleensis]